MMIIKYLGHYTGETTGIGVTMPGDTVEVPMDLGAHLIQQSNWERVKPQMAKQNKKITKKKMKMIKDDGDELT